MNQDLEQKWRERILERLEQAGAQGLNTTGLRLPNVSSKAGKLSRSQLKKLQQTAEIGNLGTSYRPIYVLAEYFNPLETAFETLDQALLERTIRLSSKNALSKLLRGAAKNKIDEALKHLIAEGKVIRLYWAGNPLYLHTSALPGQTSHIQAQPQSNTSTAKPVSDAEVLLAYRATVREFGYQDVLIHEVFLRLGGDLETFKDVLQRACEQGQAIPNVGDWSLASAAERKAALYIGGHPHLRIRFKD